MSYIPKYMYNGNYKNPFTMSIIVAPSPDVEYEQCQAERIA